MDSTSTATYHLKGTLVGEIRPNDRDSILARLQEALPSSRLSFDPPDPEELASWRCVLRISAVVGDLYGEGTRKMWEQITTAIRRVVTPRDTCENMLYDSQYHLVDADEHRCGQVTRRLEAGGPRDLLDFSPIHCGDGLELLGGDGRWIPGRYEMAWGNNRAGVFYVHLWSGNEGACLPINEAMIFRRPQ